MKDRQGFLLFEAILSIVIITGGLLFVMRAYSTQKGSIEKSRELFESSLLLEERIFEFEEKAEIEDTLQQGEFSGNKGWSWSVNASPVSIEGSSLKVVTVDVFQKDDGLGTRYSLATFLRDGSR